jgi:hypothetical protein
MGSVNNLPTEKPSLPGSVSRSDEGCGIPGGVAALDTRVEFMRFCEHCQEERQFICAWYSLAGLIGRCLYCGTPDVAEYTRVNSEVA